MDKLNSGLYTAEEIINDVGKVSRMPHKDLGKWNWDIKTRIRYSKKIIIGVTECKELFGEAIIKNNSRCIQRIEENLYMFTLAKYTPGNI